MVTTPIKILHVKKKLLKLEAKLRVAKEASSRKLMKTYRISVKKFAKIGCKNQFLWLKKTISVQAINCKIGSKKLCVATEAKNLN